VVTITLPPLREHREDIPLLATHFLGAYAAANTQPPCGISPETMNLLVRYDWPGNVRELQHAIERAAALRTKPDLVPEDLPPRLLEGGVSRDTGAGPFSLQQVVRTHVRRVLKEARWNKKLAAQLLGIHRRTLYRLTKRHGIRPEERE